MNRIVGLLLFLSLATSFTATAGHISENQARTIAANFMAGRTLQQTKLDMAYRAPLQENTAGSENAAYYVFNNELNHHGFVIVAGDDRAPAVLGYSNNGTFDSQNVPEAMKELLKSYTVQIEALDRGARAMTLSSSGPAISPLVTAAWSQNSPYNISLPFLTNGKHAYVGCVATAMAQIMYYWKWPEITTKAIPAYTTSSLAIPMPELPIVSFDWANMQDTYLTDDTTSVAALAASELSLYCAQSVGMNFKTTGSAAITAQVAQSMNDYFGYSATARTVKRSNFTTDGWNNLMYAELAAGRPILYSAAIPAGGHAFVCDGYDGNGMFHINWGWNGMHNGFFVLNVLNPESKGTGSADGTWGFVYRQTALIGIEPDNGAPFVLELTSDDLTLMSSNGTRNSSSANFSVTVSADFYNYTSRVIDFTYGWGLFQGDSLLTVISRTDKTGLAPGLFFMNYGKVLEFGKNLTSGTYQIKPMFTEYGGNDWRPCIGADFDYIEVTINGNSCTFVGHGSAAELDYTVNDITCQGNMHNGRPVNVTLNLTNNGESNNILMYMFADNVFVSTAYVDVEKGETGDLQFVYVPASAGSHVLKFSFKNTGVNPIATRNIVIDEMPAADLSGSLQVLNITDAANSVTTGEQFSVQLTVTNNSTTPYDEDISATLFKHTHDNTGGRMQSVNKRITLAAGETKTLQFDFDNVIDGWKYFVKTFYYSSGEQIALVGCDLYTLQFPDTAEAKLGDVDGDGSVNISDVTALIDLLLGGGTISNPAADCNQDSSINISDVTVLIDYLLSNHW